MNKEMKLLFSLTSKDFDWEYFCTGGNGGQHRNSTKNGVRCIHRASGARAEHRDGREQYRNRQEAFRKCCETKEFKAWHKLEVARRTGEQARIEKYVNSEVDRQMALSNLKIETYEVEDGE